MRHPITLFFFAVFVLVCTACEPAPPVDPLQVLRDKYENALSIGFNFDYTWNNTFLQDTSVDHHSATYLRSDHEVFPYDFVYELDSFSSIMDNGRMTDVDHRKGRLVTYTDEEANQDLAGEGSYATSNSPIMEVKDTLWQRAGSEGATVHYEYVSDYDLGKEGINHLVRRLHIDTSTMLLTVIEQTLTNGGRQVQHLVRRYSDWQFDHIDRLEYKFPEYPTIAKADVDKQEENAGLKPGDRLPDLNAADLDGNRITRQDLLGQRTVLVFSFIGCGGCEQTRRELASMDFTFADGYQGIYLNPRDKPDRIETYHADKPWPLRMATTNYVFAEACGVFAYPTFIALDERGVVEEVVEGYEESFFAARKAVR